ncbi:MAG: glycoside hydrolase family 3 C-terminal domain-containing protein [Clostridia bacterium]|nr:glycoside hydrolase family 3 C-terminal domain-containing protein [Clostridia bacterium]
MKYKNPNLPVEERVEDLLARMTLDEKMQQLHCTGSLATFDEYYQEMLDGKARMDSSIYTYRNFDPAHINRMQEYCMNETRLGIPLLVAVEGTHGGAVPMMTVFPTTGCISATFDENYAYKMAVAEAKEAKACGFNQMYAPNCDLLREPRWGRSEECYGEDTLVVTKMCEQVTKGLQENGIGSTAKHFIGFGSPESGLNMSAAHLGEREIREFMLPPFAACVKAGAYGIMPNYLEVDGIPMHANRYWLVDVLRKELGFEGMVINDYGAAGLLYNVCKVADTILDVGKIYMDTQIDMEACSNVAYSPDLKAAIEKGEMPADCLDNAVRRVLTMKFKLGLFENPYCDEKSWREKVYTKEHRALAREIAEKGLTLIKNDGVLPLKGGENIALIGPNAEIAQLGSYTYYNYRDPDKTVDCVADRAMPLQQAMEEKFGADKVKTARGCGFALYDENMAAQAIEIAKQADVIVFAGGHNSIGAFGGEQEGLAKETSHDLDWAHTSGEGADMCDTDLLYPQKMLLKELAKLGKPIVLLVYSGKPLSITDELPICNAVLWTYGVGCEGNPVVADMLAGDVIPSGRLPFSLPRSVGHLPCHYNHYRQGKGNLYKQHGSLEKPGKDYVFSEPTSLLPFGYGISYTTFAYENLTAERQGDTCKVSVSVKNTGEYDAEHSVLIFARNVRTKIVSGVVKKLVTFKRIKLAKGEAKRVEFDIPMQQFAYIGVDMKYVPAHGEILIFTDEQATSFNA